MAYSKHGVHLSLNQIRKLARGEAVRLKHEHLTGPHYLYLTQKQLKHLHKAHSDGNGAQLHMSHEQLKHHAVHGGSILDSLKNFGSKFLDVAGNAAGKIGSKVADKLVDQAAKSIEDYATQKLFGKPKVKKTVKTGKGIGKSHKAKTTQGPNPEAMNPMLNGRQPQAIEGEGFFDDLWGGIKSFASHAEPLVLNGLAHAAANPVLLGVGIEGQPKRYPKNRARKVKHGEGLYV